MESIQDICIKKAKYPYTESNAEFLALYDTKEKQIDYYTQLACELFDKFQIDGTFTFDGVKISIEQWFNSKEKLMNLFRQHPYWDEKSKAIVFLQSEKRKCDYKLAHDLLESLISYVLENQPEESLNNDICWGVCDVSEVLNGLHNQEENTPLMSKLFVERLCGSNFFTNTLPKSLMRTLNEGGKITRFVRKCFTNMPLCSGELWDATTLSDFDKYYAKFADALSELTVEKITLLSLNFLDFMTMSNGNSWSSCHFINSYGIFHENSESSYQGMYKQGCLSYALDEPTFLLYTLPSSYEGNQYFDVQKLNRICCQYNDGILITGKCYPNNEDAMITRYRQICQLVISDITDVPNIWTFSKRIKRIGAFTETKGAHYPDYLYDAQKPTISLIKSKIDWDVDNPMVIGHEAYCLHCGDILEKSNKGWLQCYRHQKDRICEHCGRAIKWNEECRENNGKYYCVEHAFWCEYHQRWEDINYNLKLCGKDVTYNVCSSIAYSYCEICELWYPSSIMKRVKNGNEHFCPDCYQNLRFCKICGSVVKKGSDEICEDCKYIEESGLIIEETPIYKVGDIVLMKKDVRCNHFGLDGLGYMEEYQGCFAKITHVDDINGIFHATIDPYDSPEWMWSSNCFAGLVVNGNKSMIGWTIKGLREREMKIL